MNNGWIKYIAVLVLIVLLQGLVVNNIEISTWLNPMIYPVMILLLPFELGTFITMGVALFIGLSVDAMSNTFGLHASAALLIGYLRPTILRLIKPRDGYDGTLLPTVQDMGIPWFLVYSSILIFIHHFWFFTFEIFSFSKFFGIILKTFLSSLFSISLILLFLYIFYKSSRK